MTHKYFKRVLVGGKWRYFYHDPNKKKFKLHPIDVKDKTKGYYIIKMARKKDDLNKFNQKLKEIKTKGFTENIDDLRIAGKDGWTIAHEQALRGWKPKDKRILNMEDKFGYRVKDVMKYGNSVFQSIKGVIKNA